MGWLRTRKNNVFVDNNMPFNQQMSFPAKLELRTTINGIRLFRWPVKEIKNLYHESLEYQNIKVKVLNENLKNEIFDGIDIFMSFERSKTSSFHVNIRGQIISYQKGNFYFNGVILPTLNLNKVNLRVLLDRTTIEVFADDGFSVLSKYAISDLKDNQISVCSDDELLFDRFEVHKLKSIWR
tara:strand:- start:1159 stop:1704 length:546 start_codon:yes stop_codon:yes gene_type:complete